MAHLLFFAWGWVLLVLAGLGFLCWRRFKWRTRAIVAVLLGGLALFWQNSFANLNFGREYSKVTSPDGQCTAWIRHGGMWTYTVVMVCQGQEQHLPHRSGRGVPGMTRLEWITDSLLAVDQKGPAGYVFDLANYDRAHGGEGDPNKPWQRAPLPEEQRHFTDD